MGDVFQQGVMALGRANLSTARWCPSQMPMLGEDWLRFGAVTEEVCLAQSPALL
jgi:hypothetical protein